jgi:translation elongation factor P/translation initiation factor 5A
VQTCKPGDWIVDNDGDIYTVDQQTFARTYRKVDGGKYVKVTPVWAERALNAGHVKTKEGTTHYRRGDYLVFNDEDGHDGYAVDAEKFCAMYQPAD